MAKKVRVSDLKGRAKLEHEYRKKVRLANKILKRFDEENKRFILDDDYGATFHDKTIVTKKGMFRSNPTELNVKELNSRLEMIKNFIWDSDDYLRDVDMLTEVATKMEKWELNKEDGMPEISQDLADFFTFVKSMMGETFDPSKTSILQAARAMLKEGGEKNTYEQLKERFYDAWQNSEDTKTLYDLFAQQGRYI